MNKSIKNIISVDELLHSHFTKQITNAGNLAGCGIDLQLAGGMTDLFRALNAVCV